VGAPLAGRRRELEGVVLRGRLRQAREQCGLGEVEVLYGAVEEHLGGGACAVGGLIAHRPVRHVVQVLIEDPRLGMLGFQLLGQLGLDDLVFEIVAGTRLFVLLGQVDVVDDLLGERRGALQRGRAVRRVLHRRPQDPLIVQGAVVVKAVVLDVDRGMLQIRRQRGAGDDVVDRGRVDVAHRRAIGGEHLRRCASGRGLDLGEVGCRVGDVDHPAGDRQAADRQHAHDEHSAQREHASERGSSVAPPSALSIASAHGEKARPSAAAVSTPRAVVGPV
jgi:hypothetical protein